MGNLNFFTGLNSNSESIEIINIDSSGSIVNTDLGPSLSESIKILNILDISNGGTITSISPIIGEIDITEYDNSDQILAIPQKLKPIIQNTIDQPNNSPNTVTWSIETGVVELRRGNTGGLYNSVSETSFNGGSGSPTDTEWRIANGSFDNFANTFSGIANTLPSIQDIEMRVISSGNIYKVNFTNWQSSGGGGFSATSSTEGPVTDGWRLQKLADLEKLDQNIFSEDLSSNGNRIHTINAFDEIKFTQINTQGSEIFEVVISSDQHERIFSGYGIDGTTLVTQSGQEETASGINQIYEGAAQHAINGNRGLPRQRRASSGEVSQLSPYYANPSIIKVQAQVDLTTAEPTLGLLEAGNYYWNTVAGTTQNSGETVVIGLYAVKVDPDGLTLSGYIWESQDDVCVININNTLYNVDGNVLKSLEGGTVLQWVAGVPFTTTNGVIVNLGEYYISFSDETSFAVPEMTFTCVPTTTAIIPSDWNLSGAVGIVGTGLNIGGGGASNGIAEYTYSLPVQDKSTKHIFKFDLSQNVIGGNPTALRVEIIQSGIVLSTQDLLTTNITQNIEVEFTPTSNIIIRISDISTGTQGSNRDARTNNLEIETTCEAPQFLTVPVNTTIVDSSYLASASVDVQNVNTNGIIDITSQRIDQGWSFNVNEYTYTGEPDKIIISCQIHQQIANNINRQRPAPVLNLEKNDGTGWSVISKSATGYIRDASDHEQSSNTISFTDPSPGTNPQYRMSKEQDTTINGAVNSIIGSFSLNAINKIEVLI